MKLSERFKSSEDKIIHTTNGDLKVRKNGRMWLKIEGEMLRATPLKGFKFS